MGKIVTPSAFLIAQTLVDHSAMDEALKTLGVEHWVTDAKNDTAKLIEFAGKSCYMSFDTSINKNLTAAGTRANHDYIQNGIIAHRHGSVLEHATVTFFLANVSRIVTHELVRHRAGAAYSQTSGRYVRTDSVDIYIPNDIAASPQATEIFLRAVAQMEDNARELAALYEVDSLAFAIKKKLTSAFRRIIGNGQANHIVVTANHRAWRHMISMRTDPAAEEEIRVVFADISRQLRNRFPEIYGDAHVEAVDGIEVTTFQYDKV